MTDGPLVVLLCGLCGSGKTTHGQKLEAAGFIRLSVDEVIYARHGRLSMNLPSSDYVRIYEQTVAELDQELVRHLNDRRRVVLDYGRDLWTRDGREKYKRLVEEYGGQWELIYFRADRDTLLRRLAARNRSTGANAFRVDEERLDYFTSMFEEPSAEGERVLRQR